MSGVLEPPATAANLTINREPPAPATENVQSAPPPGTQIAPLDIEDAVPPAAPDRPEHPIAYITGWRLYVLTFGYIAHISIPGPPPLDIHLRYYSLCLSLLLSALETTIVSTSLVSITNALGGFGQRDWVVTSYLLTYTGSPTEPRNALALVSK